MRDSRESRLCPGASASLARWSAGRKRADLVAEEVPVALTFNSIPHVVMLATPLDLVDMGYGFTFTEALVSSPEQIRGAELHEGEAGLEVAMSVPQEQLTAMLDRRRNIMGRTGCGVCGAETIEDAIRRPAPVATGRQRPA